MGRGKGERVTPYQQDRLARVWGGMRPERKGNRGKGATPRKKQKFHKPSFLTKSCYQEESWGEGGERQ